MADAAEVAVVPSGGALRRGCRARSLPGPENAGEWHGRPRLVIVCGHRYDGGGCEGAGVSGALHQRFKSNR